MKLFRLIRVSLATKLAISVIASTAAFFALFGLVNLRSEQQFARRLVEQSADRITDLIVRSTHYEMLHNDRDALVNIIDELGSVGAIEDIRVLNKEQRVAFSTDRREVGKVVRPAVNPGLRVSSGKHGRVLGVTREIANAAECSNASCHVHPAGAQILGVIDTTLSLATVDQQIAAHRSNLTWFLVGSILFGSAAAVGFMWIVVHRPIKELMAGMYRVAAGDLEHRLPVHWDDELGDLARSFNQMAAEVGGVQAKIEEQVRRKTAELERVHKTLLHSEKMASIGKLAATVAHEINNPLFGILTYARLVLRDLLKRDIPGRDELVEQLQTIERESKRCGDLVKTLLTFSRQAPSVREPNDLNTVVHRAVLLVQHKLSMQMIELTETLAEGLPPVECDANQIQQVVLVLMVNASEAMPKGGLLEVSTQFDPAGEQGVVRVKDSGCGIPSTVLPHIFDPFFTTKEDQNRTGLGLAVAHSIVEQHAGEITVESVPGEGTEFQVKLPLAAAGVRAK